MVTLSKKCVAPPINMGDVILENISAGIHVIASEDIR